MSQRFTENHLMRLGKSQKGNPALIPKRGNDIDVGFLLSHQGAKFRNCVLPSGYKTPDEPMIAWGVALQPVKSMTPIPPASADFSFTQENFDWWADAAGSGRPTFVTTPEDT